MNDVLLKRVLYGISCRNYEAAAEAVPGAIGLSSSTVSRSFIQASAATLREFQERDLSGEDVVALFLDGKAFADSTMVVALGITMSGEKRFLGFVETDTENAKVLTPFLRSLVDRGLDASHGRLVILDGGKGGRAAGRGGEEATAAVGRRQRPRWGARASRWWSRRSGRWRRNWRRSRTRAMSAETWWRLPQRTPKKTPARCGWRTRVSDVEEALASGDWEQLRRSWAMAHATAPAAEKEAVSPLEIAQWVRERLRQDRDDTRTYVDSLSGPWRTCWPAGVSTSPMRPSGSGVGGSVLSMRADYGADVAGSETPGISTRCSSRSRVASSTCGAPWMRTVTSWTSSCNHDGIGTPRCDSFAGY